MIDNVTFGAFVRTLRKEKQMTQLELAKILNLSDKTISKWEQGKAFPDIAVWEALAEALEVTVAELFAGEKLPKALQWQQMKSGKKRKDTGDC